MTLEKTTAWIKKVRECQFFQSLVSRAPIQWRNRFKILKKKEQAPSEKNWMKSVAADLRLRVKQLTFDIPVKKCDLIGSIGL